MKRKYADMYYSVKKTGDWWTWQIYFNYKDKKPCQTSLDNESKDDQYLSSETAARTDAIDAIQNHYS